MYLFFDGELHECEGIRKKKNPSVNDSVSASLEERISKKRNHTLLPDSGGLLKQALKEL